MGEIGWEERKGEDERRGVGQLQQRQLQQQQLLLLSRWAFSWCAGWFEALRDRSISATYCVVNDPLDGY